MASKSIVLITGANTGLGFETVESLCRSSHAYTILLGGRSLDKADAAAERARVEFPETSSVIKTVQIDVEDDDSIARVSEHISEEYGRLDTLINNAGANFDTQADKLGLRAAFNKSWDVNVSGTHVLTHTLVPLLLKSSDPRLLFLASGTATLAGTADTSQKFNQSPAKGWPKDNGISTTAYRSSKTGMNMLMCEWARVLKEDGVKVWAVSPGFLATGLAFKNPEMLKKMGAMDPKIGADLIRDVVEGAKDQDIGKVVDQRGIQTW